MKQPIRPAGELLTWLDAHTSPRAQLGGEISIRLPVSVTLTSNGVYIETAHVGDLEIEVDDRTLAVPIAGKLGLYFGDGARRGVVSVIGFWRGDRTFQVREVLGAALEGDAAERLD